MKIFVYLGRCVNYIFIEGGRRKKRRTQGNLYADIVTYSYRAKKYEVQGQIDKCQVALCSKFSEKYIVHFYVKDSMYSRQL